MQHLSILKQAIARNERYHPIGVEINWKEIDDFVQEHVEGLVAVYGKSMVRQAIDGDDGNSKIAALFGYIIEVGGALLLSRISMKKYAADSEEAYCYITSLLMDRCLNHYFRESDLYLTNATNYYNEKTVIALSKRIHQHYIKASSDQADNFNEYSKRLYMIFLLGLTNCTYLKWL